MKKVRTKKENGIWYYKKILPDYSNDLDAPLYELYDETEKFISTFGCYSDMIYYIENGIII